MIAWILFVGVAVSEILELSRKCIDLIQIQCPAVSLYHDEMSTASVHGLKVKLLNVHDGI